MKCCVVVSFETFPDSEEGRVPEGWRRTFRSPASTLPWHSHC